MLQINQADSYWLPTIELVQVKLKNCGLANQEKIRWAATQLIILSLLGYRQKCSDKHLLFTIASRFFSLNQLYSFKVPGAIRYAYAIYYSSTHFLLLSNGRTAAKKPPASISQYFTIIVID